jgi:molybdopterin-guanine dinucleotide biosynthesis protein A
LSGFVLAGGKSRRMGQDKAMLHFRNHSLLDHMVQLLSTVANPVRVVGRGILPDQIPDCGPLGGILTALDASESAMNLIVAVDLPLLSPEFLQWFCIRLAN